MLEQCAVQPHHFLSSLSVRVGDTWLMTQAQHATTGNLKGTKGAREEAARKAYSKWLEPGCRDRVPVRELPEERGPQLESN